MEKGCYVKDITPAAEARGLFVVSHAVQSQSRNGPYWRLTLDDASGSLEAKIWHPLSAEFSNIPTGSLVWAEGRAGLYREQIQLTVDQMRILSPREAEEADKAALLPHGPYDPDAMLEELLALVKEEFHYSPWRKLAFSVFKNQELRSAFRVCPAAKSIHHAYMGGLLEHTLSVFKLCRRIAEQYPELDRQTLLCGALFHDLGKIREFSGGITNDYTCEGRLLGHLELGIELLVPHMAASGLEEDLQRHLKHLILSHHGEPEFGAARPPHTPEAFALHHADNLDAKMAQCRGLFAHLGEDGQDWTPWQSSLGRQMHRAARTPETPAATGRKKAPREACLSLLKA
ncbi:3'-5' exoribonuclease YhaM family protein [Candidatus Desulfovibrio trichonymphae]|uniref:3'-5' exoribonuclease n=1 Tax=Candidatus Desulfovibrio trichonymphae TaxID=1725232 RepID=A0A1J1DW99_9BACT|nr:HD domain-containing protein [Candidatus Desulfovibrio trichonymphae]BAV92148.1 3'-5' exoribonuclease [Candidatus Desulfovibrio trichonymphae]